MFARIGTSHEHLNTNNKGVLLMSNENYTTLSNEELIKLVDDILSKFTMNFYGRILNNHHKDLHDEIMRRTSFLDKSHPIPFTARLYCIRNNLSSNPRCSCEGCQNTVEWYGKTNGFRKYCSSECKNRDEKFWNKVQDTCEDRYGVRNPFQSDEIKERIKEINMDNLGVPYPMMSEEVRRKSVESCIGKYGCSNVMMSPIVQQKSQETTFNHFGVYHSLESEVCKEKARRTCIEKYGVDNFSKSKFFTGYVKRIYHDGIWFDSSWEIKVYDFLKEHDIEFKYQVGPIEYEYDGKTHYYFPDFLVGNRLIEVKGDHFFRVNESGKEVMVCPYRYPEWSEEFYQWKCGLYEAKHQCMITNNVRILRESDINNITTGLFR